MDNIYGKEEFLTKIKEYVDYCKKCGFCKAVCPVYKTSEYIETYSPRGRMLLLQGLSEGKLRPREYLALRLYCTLCGYCTVKCISGLELTDAYIAGRAYLHASGVVLNEINSIINNLTKFDNPYGVDQSVKAMWIDYLPERPTINGKILYWSGCTSSIRNPESSANAYQLISSLVGSVSVLESEPCCGWPLYLAGDVEGYRKQLEKVLEAVKSSRAEVLVTTCPACTRSLRDKAKELGIKSNIKIYHMVEFLAELDREGRLPKMELNEAVTYHDPCELGRHMKLVEEPRMIMNKIYGLKLVEMKGNRLESNCCGGGGLYLPLNPERSSSVALKRLSDLPEGIKKLVTACPSCKVQLSMAAQKIGLDLEVMDISELILRAITSTTNR